jgi:hypothetical protein
MTTVRNRFQTPLNFGLDGQTAKLVSPCHRTSESVYAIHHPKFRFDSDWFVSTKDRCESRLPHDQRLDDLIKKVRGAYAEGRASVWTRFSMGLAMNKESGLGGTERSVADRLDVNRSVVNVAVNHGGLGSLPLIDLMSNPFVLYHIFVNHLDLCRLMGQNGFIEAAKCVGSFNGVDPQAIAHMSFVPYHLLCRDIEIRSDDNWSRPLNPSEVAAIVSSLTNPTVKLIPDSFSKNSREAARQLLHELADFEFAANYIQSLETDWLEIYVQTFAIVEGIGCDDLWEHD